MLTTTLNLSTVRTNGGKTAVVANLSDGRECFVGLSDAIGGKRARYEVLTNGGSGATIVETEKIIRRLEKVERNILDKQDDDLVRVAAELGIDLSDDRPHVIETAWGDPVCTN